MARFVYPATVPVLRPGQIGTGLYFADSSRKKPCCAIGWAFHCRISNRLSPVISKFAKTYSNVANARGHFGSPVAINDRLRPKERALLFNATTAAMGYTEGNDPEAVELARKAGY